ncbi:MAG TPA: hypothetical protein VHU80_05520 [Polyangiaceae bacterium]|jgi:hypothetical protein|nr:hypothetical protein [Polyangiaceae bacterium]
MTELDRLVDCSKLSLTAVTLVIAGCGGGSSGGPSAGVGGGGGIVTSAGAGGVAAPGTGGAVATMTASGAAAPVGTGGIPASVGSGGATTTPISSGGTTTTMPVSSGGATNTPGSGGATTSAGGSAGNGNGTANGTANDSWSTASNLDSKGQLIAPPSDKGFQIATPTFELEPGQEVFKCYHVALPNSGTFNVGDWESQMSPGSHHFILYKTDTDFAASGTLDTIGCTTSFMTGGQWIYSAAVPHTHLSMPDGVAMAIGSAQKVQFDMHYINTGADPLQAHVTLNAVQVAGTQFKLAQTQVSFNTNINIPPNGTQTVGGDCTPAAGANYFMMLTHTHRRGVDASITRKLASGQLGEVLVHTTNWDSPENILWENPPYLTFQAGEKFHYKCSYQNDRGTNTTVGVSAANNEMCMAITYFFPSTGTGQPLCTSDVE